MSASLAVTAFVSAALAFLVEPLVAKLLLPTFGGSAAVWTTALVFFQASLVVGYVIAHVTLRALGVRRHLVAQVAIVLVPVAILPIGLAGSARPPDDAPVALWLLGVLAIVVGLPFVALATTGPTVQRWFAATAIPGAGEPYRLYAASNAGSLIGLLAYPTVVEPNLDLPTQAAWWSVGYAGFVALTIATAVLVRRRVVRDGDAVPSHIAVGVVTEAPARDPVTSGTDAATSTPGPGDRRTWLALAAVPAALLVGVTAHLTTDVAAVPFLWIVPLALYLVTLILAFARVRPLLLRSATVGSPVVVVLAVASFVGIIERPLWAVFAIHLGLLVVVGLVLHGRLALARPTADRLTEYNLCIAVGGAFGGLAAGILAPLVLPIAIEEQIALVAAVVLVAGTWRRSGPRRVDLAAVTVRRIAAPIVAIVLLAAVVAQPAALHTSRTFYGTYRVVEEAPGRRVLYSGTTIHGRQDRAPGEAAEPGSYYHRGGPLGQILTARLSDPAPVRIGAVGLGAGTIAAYGRPGDRFAFIEIDPAVVDIADDPALFTYLADSAADIDVRVGDGRLLLEDVLEGAYDVLVMDAFSSDAIPVHLLTTEAIADQMRTVAPGGVIAYHVSNRYLDLEPVVAAAAHDLGLVAILGSELPPEAATGRADASRWVIVARAYRDLADLATSSDWRTAHRGDHRAWTDRSSDLWSVLDPD